MLYWERRDPCADGMLSSALCWTQLIKFKWIAVVRCIFLSPYFLILLENAILRLILANHVFELFPFALNLAVVRKVWRWWRKTEFSLNCLLQSPRWAGHLVLSHGGKCSACAFSVHLYRTPTCIAKNQEAAALHPALKFLDPSPTVTV